MRIAACLSSDAMRWSTPAWLVDYAVRRWRLTFDAAASPRTATVRRYAAAPGWSLRFRGLAVGAGAGRMLGAAGLRAPAATDGLSGAPWLGPSWLNPPYGRAIKLWTAEAARQVAAGHVPIVVGLVGHKPDTSWWHESCLAYASEIVTIRGRLRFELDGRTLSAAPFPSALVVWTPAGIRMRKPRRSVLDARAGHRPG